MVDFQLLLALRVNQRVHFSLYHHCTTTILGEIPIQHHPKPILKPSVTPPEAADAVQSAQSALAMEENGDNGHRPKEKEHKEAAAPAWWIFRGKSGISPAKMGMYCDCKPEK